MSKFLLRVRIAYGTHPVGTLLGAFLIYVVVAIALAAAAPYLPGEADHVMTEADEFWGAILTWVVLFFSLLVAPFFTSTRP